MFPSIPCNEMAQHDILLFLELLPFVPHILSCEGQSVVRHTNRYRLCLIFPYNVFLRVLIIYLEILQTVLVSVVHLPLVRTILVRSDNKVILGYVLEAHIAVLADSNSLN